MKSNGLTKRQVVSMFNKEFGSITLTKEQKQEAFYLYLENLERLGIIKGHKGKTWKNPF